MSRFIEFGGRHDLSVPMKFVAANVVVWLVVRLAAICGVDLLPWLSLPSGIGALTHDAPWSPFTYMWTHWSFWHLLFNMLWLYWFGEFFLTLQTNRQFVALYIYGGLIGAMLYLIVCPAGATLCGASASVLAIVVATAMRMPRFRMQLLLLGGVELRWIALATVALSVLALPGENFGGNIAHLGGALAGAIFAFALSRGVDLTRLPRVFKKRKKAVKTDDRILDEILDKVKRSGYNSLNSTERKKLIELSNKL
ncbi:MAG: rhomboid family intramembrane serine protease [Muribaculaceae bacterium]|nr:rhomboid family intramembrane serine protease [Muribaculaceae bacterium]